MAEAAAAGNKARHCGFVALVGAPNVGKSTLLNRIVGAKVSIVSPKVQTTRMRILGIVVSRGAQIVFVDTPGIFSPRKRLDRAMVQAAWSGAADADLVVLLVDAKLGFDADTRRIVSRLKESSAPAVLALNKIDLVKKQDLLTLTEAMNREGEFVATRMVSARTGDGVDDLVALLAACLPAGPWLFPEDQITDIPLRLLAAEITREKLFLQLQQELPYAVAVETEEWREKKGGGVVIHQVIYVRRPSQKAIVLGKGGQRIKSIGEASRHELTHLFERPVHLYLHVKVREKWIEDPERYRVLGLDYNA
jgi:GTP-binding protein Era